MSTRRSPESLGRPFVPAPGSQAAEILSRVDKGLLDNKELLHWWLEAERQQRLQWSPVARQGERGNSNGMFLAEAPLSAGLLPTIGLAQESFYDSPNTPEGFQARGAETFQRQARDYMLGYFMRTSTTRSFRDEVLSGSGPRTWEGSQRFSYQGWGYYQLYFKLRSTGEIYEFLPEERFRIIDLRDIGDVYEWVVFQVRFFDFTFDRTLLTADGPRLQVPVKLDNFVVIDRDFIVDRDRPEPGVLGEYGFGTPVVPVPDPTSILAYGPSSLSIAFQFVTFRVLESGEVRARMALVANRPTQIFDVQPYDLALDVAETVTFGLLRPLTRRLRAGLQRAGLPPIPILFTGVDLANSLSGNLARYQMCISRQQIYRDVMATHFSALNDFILQTLPTWNSVADWGDPRTFPPWILESLPIDAPPVPSYRVPAHAPEPPSDSPPPGAPS